MPNMRNHFNALLARVNPTAERESLVAERVGAVRDFLEAHEYPTSAPHTRLTGSYGRATAIEDIPDADVLLFVPDSELDRTPNASLRELQGVLKEFPGGVIETKGQRRSVRISLEADSIVMDLVPAVAVNGIEKPVKVPDRPQAEWILSDPLGYADRLSSLNKNHGGKVVPLVKLFKAWRNEQMKRARPKSYVLEVMLVHALEAAELTLVDRGYAENYRDLLAHIADKYQDLMDNGTEAPRVKDPQLSSVLITKGWKRTDFETFMKRIRESRSWAERAIAAEDEESAGNQWAKVFGSRWPTDPEVKRAAKADALTVQPGLTSVFSNGRVVGGVGASVASLQTRFHG